MGFNDHGTWLLLVVIDGRQPGLSEGVTLYELAIILQSLGCNQSINMDGGGGSIMLIRNAGGEVRNSTARQTGLTGYVMECCHPL